MARKSRAAVAVVASVGYLLAAAPATAQVVGEWQYEAYDFPSSIRITRDRADPRKMTGVGDLGGHLVVFTGTYSNLRWHGLWFWWGAGDSPPRGIWGCRYPSSAPPGSPGPNTRTSTYGSFDFSFNAAENKLDGWWKTDCRMTPANARRPGPVTFSAFRMNTLVAAPQSTPFTGGATSANPTRDDRPTLMGEEVLSDRPCSQNARIKISADGSSSVPDTVFSTRYQMRPCVVDMTSKVQIDFLNPEGKRPIRLRLERLRLNSAEGEAPGQVITAVPIGGTLQEGLRFAGVPRAGQSIMNISFGGRICAAPLWLAWLDFSDGTRSSEPIGIVLSMCGVRLHPELLPPRARPSSPEGIRLPSSVKPRGS